VPFDSSANIVPNSAGRVLPGVGEDGLGGLYVAGWLKRGPSGIIGTNIPDAVETATSVLQDHAGDSDGEDGASGLSQLLEQRGVAFIHYDGWLRVDQFELAAGERDGKVRQKIVSVVKMLDVAQP
jgi:NADPH-dependent glutamate synthase beta subunit-like oxidoreductase